MSTVNLNVDRLKECRTKLGISKIEAARRIGISQPAYLRYEAGARVPSLQVIKEIASVFNTSPEYLMGISEIDAPTSITVNKQVQPELYELIYKYNQLDSSQAKRLLSYVEKLNAE